MVVFPFNFFETSAQKLSASIEMSSAALQITQEDVSLLLAAQCHLGVKNVEKAMEPYVWRTRKDG